MEKVKYLILGAGPAGLTFANRLKELSEDSFLVLEKEQEAGMGQGKRAWIYCAIDAPEDRNGALKSQFKQLIDYGEQMGFELVGSSSDVGTTPLWNRNGFRHFIEAVQREQVDVLLIVNRGRLSRSSMQLARFQILQESYDVDAYSPLEGKIEFGS